MARFQKGQSGNPAGRMKGQPTKVHREVRDLARRILDSDYWRLKYQRLHDGTEHPKIEALLLEYAYGAPAKEIHSTGVVVHLGPLEALRTPSGSGTIDTEATIMAGTTETDTADNTRKVARPPTLLVAKGPAGDEPQ